MIVLVAAEYLADSVLWFRGGSEVDRWDVDDAAALGVSAALRDDLRAWNDRFEQLSSHVFDDRHDPEVAPDPAPPELWDAHRVEAFELAARVQLELGDDVHVWCGDGGGTDAVAERGTVVVLPSGRQGSGAGRSRGTRTGRLLVRSGGTVPPRRPRPRVIAAAGCPRSDTAGGPDIRLATTSSASRA